MDRFLEHSLSRVPWWTFTLAMTCAAIIITAATCVNTVLINRIYHHVAHSCPACAKESP